MKSRFILALLAGACSLLAGTGCAVVREQQTVGEYVDDAAITARIKARFAEDPTVSALAISVETLNGTAQLSGFAKTAEERMRAERLARDTPGVRQVNNGIQVGH
ncbi:MAG: BON domain-containing protein [Pseudomonadota bacterium]